MKKFLLIFFVVLLCSVVFSQTVDDPKIDVLKLLPKLFANAEQTVDALNFPVPVLAGSISGEIFVDSMSVTKYMDRFGVPEGDRNSWLESNTFEEEFEVVKGSAYRIKKLNGEFSDYFVWVKEIDFDKKQVSVYIITNDKRYGVKENVSEVENVSLMDFKIVGCGVTGVLGVGESFSCLLPELDGSTVTITIKSLNSRKEVSLRVKWGYSFFRDVFWEDRWLNIEYAGKRDGYAVRKDSEDEFIKYYDLMVEDFEQYVFKFPAADAEKDVSFLVFVSSLYSEEVRFSIGYVDLDREVSWLDLEASKEFSADRIPSEFIAFECAPGELWVNELVFTKEELEKGKNVKTCYIGDFSEPTEIIQVKVDSISNGGRTVSFKVKHVDVSPAFNEIAKLIGKEDSSMLEVFGSEKVVDLFLAYPSEFVEIANAAVPYSISVFDVLRNENVADLFAANPDAFVEIANAAGVYSDEAFIVLENKNIAGLFVSDPDVVVNAFVKITKALGTSSGHAFSLLKNEEVASLFVSDPDLVIDAIAEINNASRMRRGGALLFALSDDEKLADLFAGNPDAFVKLAKVVGSLRSSYVFDFLRNESVADLFVSDPDLVIDAIAEIVNKSGEMYWDVFYSFRMERVPERFLDYCNKKISFDQFMTTVLSSDSLAIETGRPLDDLHFQQEKREQYLDSLSTLQVFILLNSNPEFFYTSSNNMLFDRLKKDLGEKSVTQLFEEYALIGTDDSRNFLFRAINYDRFYGKENSLLDESDVTILLPTLLQPLNSDEFDKKYFFMLANALDGIKGVPEAINQAKQVSESRLQEGIEDKELKAGFEFIVILIDEETNLVPEEKKRLVIELEKKSIFDPELYMNNGKLTVLQVFDKEDTGKDHWFMTQDWFSAYFGNAPVTGADGELVYENADEKMILFMGDDETQNQEFIRKQLYKTPNIIVTFRGHSYSLLNSFPYSIFGNNDSHILFIPGSCGSAGSTPEYIYANPETDLRFISNTSTGRGQVTNTIVGALLESEKRSFQSVIADSTASIVKYGGNVSTIKFLSRGELLLRYVLDETRQ